MATYASRPAWDVRDRARALTSGRLAAPAGLGLLCAISLYLRTRELGIGFWIDEGLSVGISDRPLSHIPTALREDGSPPLYYTLLHFWIRLFGTGEAQVRGLSLLCALAIIPLAWWAARALFGSRAGWIAAVAAALNPFLTQYAQEARMYALVALLSMLATTCFVYAYALDTGSARARRPWLAGFAVGVAAALYTHNWTLFFVAACAAAWLALYLLADRARRRELVHDGLLGFGGAAVLYLPWIPITLYQAAHTGAPWSEVPSVARLAGVAGVLLGRMPQFVLLLAAGSGLLALVAPAGRRLSAQGRAVVALAIIAVVTVLLAWLSSQVSPAWANRYLAIALPAFLLLCAGGVANAGRLGLVGLAVVTIMWLGDGAPAEKSNVRTVAEAIAPSLAPGDLVISTQPETVPVLRYYLGAGPRYATLTGAVADTGVWDWRDGVPRLEAMTPARDLQPLLDRLPAGHRVVLVEPIITSLRGWRAPWTKLVRIRSQEWRQYLSDDPRLRTTAVQPALFTPPRPNPVRATVMVKVRR
jgi:mannosyltransferase